MDERISDFYSFIQFDFWVCLLFKKLVLLSKVVMQSLYFMGVMKPLYSGKPMQLMKFCVGWLVAM